MFDCEYVIWKNTISIYFYVFALIVGIYSVFLQFQSNSSSFDIDDINYFKLCFVVMTHRSTVKRAIEFNNNFKTNIASCKFCNGPYFFSAPPSLLRNLSVLPLNKKYLESLHTYPIIQTKLGNIDLTLKFLSSLQFFLQKTDCDYIIRVTDDVFVNFRELPFFVRDLEKFGDPRTNVVILGQCMHVRGRTLLQGGSGYLFSRRAAEVFLAEAHLLISSIDVYEDWVIASTISKIVQNIETAFSPHFMGHGFNKSDWKKLLSQDFSHFPRCPKKFWTVGCQSMQTPLSRTVFFHQFGFEPKYHQWEYIIKNAPHDLYWYQSWYHARICRMTEPRPENEEIPPNKGDSILSPEEMRDIADIELITIN